jgi:hypothetical protein
MIAWIAAFAALLFDEPPRYLARLFSPENIPNIALVIVGVVGIIVAIRTLDDLKTQTAIASKAADAALRNAQAVINAELAWIVVELHPLARRDHDGQWIDENGGRLTTEDIVAGKHTAYSLRIKNMGRTPAQILSYQFNYTALPEGVTDLKPNKEGDTSQTSEFIHFLPNGSDPMDILPALKVGIYMRRYETEIAEFKITAVFYGWVKYRHMFSTDECRSDYCFTYRPSQKTFWRVGRDTKYT